MSTSQIPHLLRNDVATPFPHHPIPLLSTSMSSSTITAMDLKLQNHASDLITVLLALHLSRAVATVQPRLSLIKASLAQALASHEGREKFRTEAYERQQSKEAEEKASGEWYEREDSCGTRAASEAWLREEQASVRALAAERIKEGSAWLERLEEKLGEAVLDLVLMWKAGEGEVA